MKRTVTLENVPYKKAKTYRKRKQIVPRKIPGGPMFDPTSDNLKVRMRYCKLLVMNANATPQDIETYVFRANSIWDPEYTGIGRKALGLSYYQDMYNKYRVLRSTIKITPADNNQKGMCFIWKSPRNILASTDFETTIEKKETVVKSLRDESGSLWHSFNMREDKHLESEPWTGMGSNPTGDWFFFVGHNSLNATQLLVELFYDVELSDRKPIVSA